MKLENRTQLTLLREQCQEKRNKETCKILVCGGTGCLAGGSDKIFDRFSELTAGMDHVEVRIGAEIAHGEHVGVKKSGCHGFCEMGPLVRIEPYNYLYLKVKLEDCEEIFEKTVLHGEPVTRLMYKQDNEVYQTQEEIPFYAKQTRLVLKNCGHIDAEHIEDALAVGAYEAFEKAVFEMTPEDSNQDDYPVKSAWTWRRWFPDWIENGPRLHGQKKRSVMSSAMVMKEIREHSWTEASWKEIRIA